MNKINIKLVTEKWMQKNVPSIYAEGYSWYETIMILTSKLNEVIEQVNNYFNKDLETVVYNVLDGWKNEGVFDDILNGLVDEALKKIDDSLNKIDEKTNALENQNIEFKEEIKKELLEQFNKQDEKTNVLENQNREFKEEIKKELLDQFNNQRELLQDYAIKDGLHVEDYDIDTTGKIDSTTGMQKIIDDALTQDKPIILKGRILVNGTLFIDKDKNDRRTMNFYNGVLIKNNDGDLFSSRLALDPAPHQTPAGNVRFLGTRFESVEGAGTRVFDVLKLLRIYFSNCDFINFDHLIYSTDSKAYTQTLYIDSCVITGGKGYFIDVNNSYDISITQSVVEHRDSLMNVNIHNSTRINGNCIEGLNAQVLRFGSGRSIEISSNYFEQNCKTVDKPYIEHYYFGSVYNLHINKNMFLDNFSFRDYNTYFLIELQNIDGFNIQDNSVDQNFIKVKAKNTIEPKHIEIAFKNKSLKDSINAINEYKFKPIMYGNGNLIPNFQHPIGSYVGHIGDKNAPYATELSTDTGSYVGIDVNKTIYIAANAPLRDNVGFKTNTFELQPYQDYVIGINCRNTSETNDLVVEVVNNADNKAVFSHTIRQEDFFRYSSIIPKFWTLPSFTVNNGVYYIRVKLYNDGNNLDTQKQYYINDIVIQKGTIATLSTKPIPLQLES